MNDCSKNIDKLAPNFGLHVFSISAHYRAEVTQGWNLSNLDCG